jgi:hypothetical protein
LSVQKAGLPLFVGQNAIAMKYTVYRTIQIDGTDGIDFQKLGNHWTFDEVVAQDLPKKLGYDEDKCYTLIAQVDDSQIDWAQSTAQYKYHPEEIEAFVESKNVTVKVVDQDFDTVIEWTESATGYEITNEDSESMGNRNEVTEEEINHYQKFVEEID